MTTTRQLDKKNSWKLAEKGMFFSRILGWRVQHFYGLFVQHVPCVFFLCTLCLEPQIVGVALCCHTIETMKPSGVVTSFIPGEMFFESLGYILVTRSDDISRLWGSWSSQSIACHLDHVELSWHHFTLSGWFLWPPSSGFCRSCQEILEETHPQSSLKRTS